MKIHIKFVNSAGEKFIPYKKHSHIQCCDKCWEQDEPNNEYFKNWMLIQTYINNIFQREFKHSLYSAFSDLIYNKFFNKQNLNKTNIAEFRQNKFKYAIQISKIIQKFIIHLTEYSIKFNWDFNTIESCLNCLYKCTLNTPGFVINEIDNEIKYSTALYGWANICGNNFTSVINMFNEFISHTYQGKGEFFWSIINNNIITNSTNKADVLFNNNTLAEIKLAVNSTCCGRLLFNRKNYFPISNINNWFNNIKQSISTFLTNNNIKLNLDEILTSAHNCTWNNNGDFHKLIHNVNNINPAITTKLIHHIFNISINFNDFTPRFLNLDLTNKNNFKLFHFVNYCLYYIMEDAKSENLNYLTFITDNNILTISKQTLLNKSENELIKIISNWNIHYPTTGFTKNDNIWHDRNKSQAPGIFFNYKGE